MSLQVELPTTKTPPILKQVEDFSICTCKDSKKFVSKTVIAIMAIVTLIGIAATISFLAIKINPKSKLIAVAISLSSVLTVNMIGIGIIGTFMSFVDDPCACEYCCC